MSRFTDAKVLVGNQQLLMQMINKRQIDMKCLNNYSAKELNDFLKRIGVGKTEINK